MLHRSVSDYARAMPYHVDAARQAIAPMTTAARDIQPAHAALNAAWRATRRDVDKTQYYTDEECTGVGEEEICYEVRKSRQVYDYSIHTYTYNRSEGLRAAQLLEEFRQRHPDVAIKERLLLTQKISPENAQAITQSRRQLAADGALTQRQLLDFANTWAMGSTLTAKAPLVASAHARLTQLAPQWTAAAATSSSVTYRTESRSDAGPQGYQIAQVAMTAAQQLSSSAAEIDAGMASARVAVPALNSKIGTYIRVVLHGAVGDPDQLRREIMQDARTLYTQNFKAGFDVSPAKWWVVALWSLLGLAVGGGLGFGVDRLTTRKLRPAP